MAHLFLKNNTHVVLTLSLSLNVPLDFQTLKVKYTVFVFAQPVLRSLRSIPFMLRFFGEINIATNFDTKLLLYMYVVCRCYA